MSTSDSGGATTGEGLPGIALQPNGGPKGFASDLEER